MKNPKYNSMSKIVFFEREKSQTPYRFECFSIGDFETHDVSFDECNFRTEIPKLVVLMRLFVHKQLAETMVQIINRQMGLVFVEFPCQKNRCFCFFLDDCLSNQRKLTVALPLRFCA